jgi:hypothetical protein
MTAHDLIADIFSRVQSGPGNMRRITRPQLNLLCRLIGEDKDAGAVQHGLGDSLVWTPSGRNKYIITEDSRGNRHTLTRLANLSATGMDSLF